MKLRLYYLYMDGCESCTKGKPYLAKFEKRHPEVEVVRVDLLTANWTHPWKPDATPTYVLEVPGRPRTRYEGWLTDKQIEEFIGRSAELMR